MFAEVSVSADPTSPSSQVHISEHVFDWLRDVHGPNAVIWDRSDANEYVRGAKRGVAFALGDPTLSGRTRRVTVLVERISVVEVDSSEQAVAYAACFATWRALGVEGGVVPRISRMDIIFPDRGANP